MLQWRWRCWWLWGMRVLISIIVIFVVAIIILPNTIIIFVIVIFLLDKIMMDAGEFAIIFAIMITISAFVIIIIPCKNISSSFLRHP